MKYNFFQSYARGGGSGGGGGGGGHYSSRSSRPLTTKDVIVILLLFAFVYITSFVLVYLYLILIDIKSFFIHNKMNKNEILYTETEKIKRQFLEFQNAWMSQDMNLVSSFFSEKLINYYQNTLYQSYL